MFFKSSLLLFLILLNAVANDCQAITKLVGHPINPLSVLPPNRDVRINLRFIHKTSTEWEIEVVTENTGSTPVFITATPTRTDGSKGPYFQVCKDDPSVLEISYRLFAKPSSYTIYSDDSRVRLIELASRKKHIEKARIQFPIKETEPPYKLPFEKRSVTANEIKYIKGVVGVLPDDEIVRDIIRRKLESGTVNGSETIDSGKYKGKVLFEVQTISSSELFDLSMQK